MAKKNRTQPKIPEVQGNDEYIELVPHGATTLRLTVFPNIAKQKNDSQIQIYTLIISKLVEDNEKQTHDHLQNKSFS